MPASAYESRHSNGTAKSSMPLHAPSWHSYEVGPTASGKAQTVETRSRSGLRYSLSVQGTGLAPSSCFVVEASVLDSYDSSDGWDHDWTTVAQGWSDETGALKVDAKVPFAGSARVGDVVRHVEVRTCGDLQDDDSELVLSSKHWD